MCKVDGEIYLCNRQIEQLTAQQLRASSRLARCGYEGPEKVEQLRRRMRSCTDQIKQLSDHVAELRGQVDS